MRTKALLLSAAFAAVAPSALAQVYSVNAVGYINLPTVAAGDFAIIANQLDKGAGMNTLDVLGTVPNGTRVYGWNEADQEYIPVTFDDYENAWLPAADAALIDLSPGKAAFIKAPDGADVNITLVGDVPQAPQGGTLTVSFPTDGKFALVSSMVPQTGDLVADLKFAPVNGDRIYRFLTDLQDYKSRTYDDYDGKWLPEEAGFEDIMTINVGEGFWLKPGATSTGEWNRAFDINDPNS